MHVVSVGRDGKLQLTRILDMKTPTRCVATGKYMLQRARGTRCYDRQGQIVADI